MGVYSTNRISSVTESGIVEDFELTPNENLGNIMEAVIGLRENELNMFNSLIELDFLSAANEATMLEADAVATNNAQNQSKIKEIFKKLEELINRGIEIVKSAFSNLVTKIKDLLDKDKKIVETYGDIKVEDLKGFEGISNILVPTVSADFDFFKSEMGAEHDVNAGIDRIKKAQSKEEVDDILKTISEYVGKITNIKVDNFFEKVDKFVPTAEQLNTAISEIKNAKKTIDNMKKSSVTVISKLKNIKTQAKKSIGDAKEDLEVYKANAAYKCSSELTGAYMKVFNTQTHIAVKQMAAYRKMVVLCGRYAKKSSKTQSNQEAAMMYVLGESSDEYVFNHFAY